MPVGFDRGLTGYVQAVRQTVRILSMDHPQGILRTGDRATVTFEFISQPEYKDVVPMFGIMNEPQATNMGQEVLSRL